jgi:hypothetical protein
MTSGGRRTHQITIAWLAATIACFAPTALTAQEKPSDDLSAPLQFRRIYAPAGEVQDWPRGNLRYVPIDPVEFERLVKLVGAMPKGGTSAADLRLVRAHYSARLEDGLFLTGQATFEIEHAKSVPALLPLTPCGLAISQPAWKNADSPAVLGLSANGEAAVLVENSDTLTFHWSLHGLRDAAGGLRFDLALPRSPQSTIELELPGGEAPEPSHGVVIREHEIDGNTGRWRIELGGKHQTALRLLPSGATREQRPTATLRTTTSYEFSARGVDVTSQLKIDALHEPLRQIELALDSGLQLVSARYGESAIPWSATTASGSDETRITLALPEPLRGAGRVVRLVAMAPWPVEQRAQLPRIRPRAMFWQEGTLNLLVPSPFEVRELAPTHARQSKVGPLPAPLAGEAIELQCFTPDATASVVVAQQRERPRLSIGTLIRLGNNEKTGQMVADFQLSAGERFAIRADVPEEWIIDAVRSVPPDAISDWILGQPENQLRPLTVRLNKALTQTHPVKLIVDARGRAPQLGKDLTPTELKVASFQEVALQTSLLGLETVGPYVVRLDDDDELLRLDAARLSTAQSHLFLEAAPEVIAELNPRKQAWRVAFEHRVARYTAQIELEAKVTAGPLVESCRVRCSPESAAVERFLVHFTQARQETPRWSLGEGMQGQLVARKLSSEAQAAAGVDPAGETWEIVLRRPQKSPFEFRAERATEFKTAIPLNLVSLPEATSQQGSLTVKSTTDSPLEIENRRLKAVAAAAAPPGQYDLTRGTFRYDPPREVDSGDDVAIRVSRPEGLAVQSGSLIWRCQTDSRYEPSGRGFHNAQLHIQNHGLASCTVRLPADSLALALWIDGARTPVTSSQGRLTLDLPSERKLVTVAIQFTTTDAPLGILTAWDLPAPQSDLPILDRRSTVWLPPGYEMLDHGRLWQTPHQQRLTWSDRLFGPLSRDRNQSPFDPLTTSGWASLFGVAPQHEESLEQAQKFLSALGGAVATNAADRSARIRTWGDLLLQTESSAALADGRLLVDRVALTEIGISAETPLPTTSAAYSISETLAAGASLLERANLVLLAEAHTLLLTSAKTAAADRWQLAPLGLESAYWVEPGPLQRQMEGGLGRESSRFVPVASWKVDAVTPWNPADPIETEAVGSEGWTAYHLDASDATPEGIYIARRAVVETAGWLVFASVAIVGCWRVRRRAASAGRWATLFAVIAVVAPSALTPITSSAVLGALFCLAIKLLLPAPRMPAAMTLAKPASTSRLALAGHLALFLFIAAILAMRCAQIDAAEQLAERVYRVFIPSDETGKPTGGRYQLPAEFKDELYRREARAIGIPEGWLIERANYRATLNRDANQTGLEVSELLAQYDLHVFRPETDVTIPINRNAASLISDRALLDGRPIELAWQTDGKSLVCRVPDAGPCRLEIPLRPAIHSTMAATGIDVQIPSVPGATVDLSVPPDAPAIELASVGTQRWSTDKQQLIAQLGPTGRLAVRWPGTLASAPVVDAEELLWLKVLPGSVILDARFHLKVVSGQLRDLQLAAESRLRMQPVTGQDAPFTEFRTVSGDPTLGPSLTTVHLNLTKPASDQVTVQASFLVAETNGIGHLRLPRLEALGVRSTRRWLAVSVDPSLESEPPDGKALTPVPAPNFMTQWGKSTVQPQAVYELPHGEVAWNLATRPRPVQTKAKQSLAISLYQGSASVYFDAELNTTNGYTFQHRLLAPKQLDIESVSVLEDDVQRVARWSQDESGMIIVFLNGPVTGQQQLSLRGSMAMPSIGTHALPFVRMEGDTFTGTTVSVFRQRAVSVELQNLTDLADAPPAVRPDSGADLGRLVKALTPTSERPAAMLAIDVNEPRAQVTQVVSLERQAQDWQATLDSRWTVESGTLDVLRFEMPPQWNGPLTIAPAVASQVVEIPGQNRRHLLIYPRSAIQGEYRVTITGPLKPTSGEPVAAPDCIPLGAEKTERYFKLPSQVGSQRVAWDVSELKASVLPQAFAAAQPVDTAEIYQAIGSHPVARLRSAQQVTATPKVRLADVHLAWHANSLCQGITVFDVEPADLESCRLELPSGLRLLELYIDGLAVTAMRAGERTWKVPLALKPLPVRVEIVFAGELTVPLGAWGDLQLAAPTLVGLPVETTLWTVYSPPRMGSGEVANVRSPSLLEMDLTRLKSITSILAQPDDGLSADRREEISAWQRPWENRWLAAHNAVRRRLLSSPRSSQMLAKETDLAKLEHDHTRIAQRLSGRRSSETSATQRPTSELAELWTESFSGGRPPVRGAHDGALGTLTVRYSRPEGAEAYWRSAYAIVSLALVGGWAIARRRGLAFMDPLRRWPHATGVLFGLMWWLWLNPSVLGLLIALASVIASLRPGFRATREASSTIMRLSAASRSI